MCLNFIYILATLCLLIGSILDFNKNLPDYFFIIGSSLFFINSILKTFVDIQENRKKEYLYYNEL